MKLDFYFATERRMVRVGLGDESPISAELRSRACPRLSRAIRCVAAAVCLALPLVTSGVASASPFRTQPEYIMGPGYAMYSAANTVLTMQTDGNFVLYHTFSYFPYSTAVWHTNTWGHPGASAVFQPDGNLVVYATNGVALWNSGTAGNPNSTMVLTDDGNLQIFNTNSSIIFSTNTSRTLPCCSGTPAGAAPFNLRLANDVNHLWSTSETDPSMVSVWNWRFAGPGGESRYEPTDLTFTYSATPASTVDVVYFVTPDLTNTSAYAETSCTAPVAGNKCDRFVIRINERSLTQNLPSHMKNNLVCHELGHTVGFNDGGTTGSSCMTSGQNSRLGWWEVATINASYP